jgi:hypothetical protein
MDIPASPRQVMASPADEQQPQPLEVLSPRPTSYSTDRTADGRYTRFPSPSTEANMEELARRRRHREELAEQEMQQEMQKEQTFEDRQKEIEMRTRELERDRALTVNTRDADTRSDASYTAKTTRTNDLQEPQRRYSQLDSPTPAIPQGRYSYSTTHLVPPSSLVQLSHSQSQPSSPAHESRSLTTADHADFCGCESCSVSKYGTRNIPAHDLHPPEPPITLRPDKPKGWIRRLSMPMGNAFSLDSKKSNPSLKKGMTSLVGEDGRIRRSFKQGGVSNWNMSNVGKR